MNQRGYARDHRRAIMVLAAVASLGFIADLISKPTMVGYMNGPSPYGVRLHEQSG